MIIKVNIEGKEFEIDCDTGTQDITWLALSACYVYGSETYPVTTFLPIIAKNKDHITLHPKLVIVKNLDLIGKEIFIKVKKKHGAIGYELNEEEKEWYDNAFLEGRFKMSVHFALRPAMELRKDNDIKVTIDHDISPSVVLFFPNYPKEIDVMLKETGRRGDLYEGDIKIPYGEIKPIKILYCDRGTNAWDKETNDMLKNDIKFNIIPEILSQSEKDDYLRKKEVSIRDKEIKIKEEIMQAEREKKEEEEKIIRLKEIMSNIPYSLEEVYMDVKDRIEMNEQDLLEVFNLLEEEDYYIYRRLYEIFSNFSQFFPIEEEGDPNGANQYIDLVAMHHFVKHYLAERPNIEELTEDFQKLYQMSFEEDAIQITFKEFIYAIITLLKNLIYKEIDVLEEIKQIAVTYDKKMTDNVFMLMYKNSEVVEMIIKHSGKLSEVFGKYCIKVLGNIEVSADNFLKMISEVSMKQKCDLIKTVNERMKLFKQIDYYEFIENLICIGIAFNNDNNNGQNMIGNNSHNNINISNSQHDESNEQNSDPNKIQEHEENDEEGYHQSIEKKETDGIELFFQYVESLLE